MLARQLQPWLQSIGLVLWKDSAGRSAVNPVIEEKHAVDLVPAGDGAHGKAGGGAGAVSGYGRGYDE